jgi:hypothetical protein
MITINLEQIVSIDNALIIDTLRTCSVVHLDNTSLCIEKKRKIEFVIYEDDDKVCADYDVKNTF